MMVHIFQIIATILQHDAGSHIPLYGHFCKFGVLVVGVFILRALPFGSVLGPDTYSHVSVCRIERCCWRPRALVEEKRSETNKTRAEFDSPGPAVGTHFEFPKIGDPFLRVLTMSIIVHWDFLGGPCLWTPPTMLGFHTL